MGLAREDAATSLRHLPPTRELQREKASACKTTSSGIPQPLWSGQGYWGISVPPLHLTPTSVPLQGADPAGRKETNPLHLIVKWIR